MSSNTRNRKRKPAENEEVRAGGGLKFGGAEDLKITVGTKKKKIFWYHSMSMASLSNYIDTVLSAPMKERDTKELSFPDITVSQWEAMVKFLTNPSASRHMTAKNATKLVALYDKYDFRSGVGLCDDVISDVFDSPDTSDSTDEKVEALVLGHAFNLPETLHWGKKWFKGCFCDDPTVSMQLKVEHIQKLQPVMAGDADISEDLELMLGQKVDVQNPMFPALFVSQFQLIAARYTVTKLVNVIYVSECEAAGSFDSNGDETIEGSLCYNNTEGRSSRVGEIYGYEISKRDAENWKIYKRVVVPSEEPILTYQSKELYECKGSRYATLPPKNGWKTEVTEPFCNTVEPKLKYFHKSSDGSLREIDTNVLLRNY